MDTFVKWLYLLNIVVNLGMSIAVPTPFCYIWLIGAQLWVLNYVLNCANEHFKETYGY